MKNVIQAHGSQARCYKCGSKDICQVCHHCSRAMCHFHIQPQLPRWLLGAVYNDFHDLGLTNHPAKEIGAHCDECLHFGFQIDLYKKIIWLLTSLFLIFISLFSVVVTSAGLNKLISAWVFIFGFGSLLVFIFIAIRNRLSSEVNRPTIPIIGSIQKISVEEEVFGEIILDQSGYGITRVNDKMHSGQIKIDAKFNTLDKERVRKYYKKYRWSLNFPTIFSVGYLLLQGKAQIRFLRKIDELHNPRPHTISLIDNLSKNLFLQGHSTNKGISWEKTYKYKFHQTTFDNEHNLPIQVYPRFIHNDGKWALELVVQITPTSSGKSFLSADGKIKKLTLEVNGEWGKPKVVNYEAVSNIAKNVEQYPTQLITWHDIKIEPTEANPRSTKLYIRFENSITKDSATPLIGKLNLEFNYAFSGIEGVKLYFPTGFTRNFETSKQSIKTKFEIDLHLDLSSLSFQHIYVPEIKPIKKKRNIPNHQFVQKIASELSKEKGYVQQILENPPRTNISDAKKINRYWRIEGRQYNQIYPIDFHIVITGIEDYKDKDTPQDGETSCELRVHAMISSVKMKEEVDKFIKIIKNILQNMEVEENLDKEGLDNFVSLDDSDVSSDFLEQTNQKPYQPFERSMNHSPSSPQSPVGR